MADRRIERVGRSIRIHGWVICFCVLAFVIAPLAAFALPTGWVDSVVIDGMNRPVGVRFTSAGDMFIWEKNGRLHYVEQGTTTPQLLLDITQEVASFRARGLMGFEIDPDFATNGYIYLMYTADIAYLLAFENADGQTYPMGTPDQIQDTISRLTRYTVNNPATNPTVDLSSRLIMIGHWSTQRDGVGALTPPHVTDGIASTSGSHVADSLHFAPDGTLLASIGDGAIWFPDPDIGQPRASGQSDNMAETNGILPVKHQIGAFRAQLIDAHNGKLLRMDVTDIDSNGGVAGAASNPFYDAGDRYAPRSRVWGFGFRNPFQFVIRPGTGSANPGDGDPGVIIVGDVGLDTWEELNVVTAGGQNFGWPLFEGLDTTPGNVGDVPPTYWDTMVANLDAPNPLFDGVTCTQANYFFTDLLVQDAFGAPTCPNPCDSNGMIASPPAFEHRRPALAFQHGADNALLPIFDASSNAVGLSLGQPLPPGATGTIANGAPFGGFSVLAGAWYSGGDLPAAFHDVMFFADTIDGWVRYARFDANHNVSEIGEFIATGETSSPTGMAVNPADGHLYYVAHFVGEIRGIFPDCNSNGIDDSLDVAGGTSTDCDSNALPDECESFDAPDYTAFESCVLGPVVIAAPQCVCVDFEPSNTIDLADYADVQRRFALP